MSYYTATLDGNGNYYNSRSQQIYIQPRSLSDTLVTVGAIADQEYTGSAITPDIYLYQELTDGSTALISQENGGYTVSYSDNTDKGTAGVTITAKDKTNYTGTREATFNIIARTLNTENTTIGVVGTYIYDGNEKTPSFNVVYNNGSKDKTLIEGTDYTVSYRQNKKVGVGGDLATTAGPYAIIEGTGKYEGTLYKGFTILGNLSDSSIFTVAWDSTDTYAIVNGEVSGLTKPVVKARCYIYRSG